MPRDNFTSLTRETLGQSVGFNCVRPGCAKPTTALSPTTGTIVSIGIAAHDSAASPGGPRYNESLTPEQRRAMDNGAWLCSSCARLVDIDPERFPEGTIRGWQQQAAAYRQQGLNMPVVPAGLDFKTACENAQRFIGKCREIQIERWNHLISWRSFCAMEELLRLSYPLIATNPYCCQFPHMVNLQNQMLEALRLVLHEVRQSGCWFMEGDYYKPALKCDFYPNEAEAERNAAIDGSRKLVEARMNDFLSLQSELRSIVFSPYGTVDLYGW